MKDFLRSVPRLTLSVVTSHSFMWALIIVSHFIHVPQLCPPCWHWALYKSLLLALSSLNDFYYSVMLHFLCEAFYSLLNLNFRSNECFYSSFDLLDLFLCLVSRALKCISPKSLHVSGPLKSKMFFTICTFLCVCVTRNT